jgi:hypothetical protein
VNFLYKTAELIVFNGTDLVSWYLTNTEGYSTMREIQPAIKMGVVLLLMLFWNSSLQAETKSADDHKKMVEKGLDFLAKNLGNGRGLRRNVSNSAVCGFAFMLHGSTPYKGPHKAALNTITNFMLNFELKEAKERSNRDGGFANWEHGFMLMYLSQIASLGEAKRVEPKVKELIRILGESQFPSGGWTHGFYGKNELDYDTLVATTVTVTHGLGMARQAGFNVPKKMIDNALKYIRDSTVGQNVGYSPRRGQKGMRRAGGRWAGTYASLIRFGRDEHSDLFKAIAPVDQFVTDTGVGHADGMWHYFMVGLSAQFVGGDFNQKFRKEHTSRIYKLQKPDGSFSEIPRLGEEQDPGQGGIRKQIP